MIGLFFIILMLIITNVVLPNAEAKRKHKKAGMPIYSSNDNEDIVPLEVHYLRVLGLENKQTIYPETITEAYFKLLQDGLDKGREGQLVFVDINEIAAAKDYLLNTWAYLNCKN